MIALSSTPTLFPNNLGCSFAFSDHYTNSTNLDLNNSNNYLFTTSTLDDHHQTQTPNILEDSNKFSSISHLQLPQHFDHLVHTPISTADFSSCEPTPPPTMVIKKLHHNASERDRRKKMNTLYSSLRSLLPASDQMKKMSIPTTVARVVKYIPELQREVEKLINKKQKLLSRIAKQEDDVLVHQENQRNQIARSSKFPSTSFSAVSVNRLGRREVVIQIPAHKGQDRPLSDLLLSLEEDGLILLNASSFQSFGGKLLVFYNWHFQVREIYKLECEDLNEKIVSWFMDMEFLEKQKLKQL